MLILIVDSFEYEELNESMINEAAMKLENDGLNEFIESSLSNLKLNRIREGG